MFKDIESREIWVLPEASHAHKGRLTRCRVFYGHAMRPGGLAEIEGVQVISPDEKKHEVKVEPGDDKFHLIAFTPDRDGFWAVAVENNLGLVEDSRDDLYCRGTRGTGYYYQYAKTYVQVGHFDVVFKDATFNRDVLVLGHKLELVFNPGVYRLGDEVTVEARYRGNPLAGVKVQATWSLREEEGWALEIKTNEKGRAKFTLDNPGHWLFHVWYTENVPGREGEYDRLVYSATSSIFGVH